MQHRQTFSHFLHNIQIFIFFLSLELFNLVAYQNRQKLCQNLGFFNFLQQILASLLKLVQLAVFVP